MNSLVSIIVPCYNHAHLLGETLESVLNQEYANWECIIVNDGSPDNTEEIAGKWCKKDIRFKYISQRNGGLSSARNTGVKRSNGEYILPLDADDLLHKDFLKKTMSVLQTEDAVGIVTCNSKHFTGDTTNVINEWRPKGNTYKYLLYLNQIVATSLLRKTCWEQVGGYDENMKNGFEDWEFWLSITKNGWKYQVLDEFLFYYRRAKQSMVTDTINYHFEDIKAYIFKKHRDLYIEDFENCMTVLFHDLKAYRTSNVKLKTSLEYKIGKLLTKPFSFLLKK
ncbi:glycosyltransferase family 2 protein [Hyunsoonleella sp. SJ7]|uniref:Glycosyltransferase family 2 protein n=1 Tax=Hyunsoonleella aquatilis TaxID=2762758 RepID=A0A923H844_9FLAO|nr:glycosyltransferase family A protein [Hyunsoonleella aquatilis]MBC3757758.1 glycosyltransferase family 2 protein [Hyunsoonleella aquatilis]